MVRLVVKKSQESLFLIDTTTDCPVKRIAHDIALINNLQLKCIRLADAADSLALHGIAKPLDLHGYTEEQLDAMATTPDIAPAESSGKVKNVVELPDGRLALDSPDPLGKRSGQGMCSPFPFGLSQIGGHAVTTQSRWTWPHSAETRRCVAESRLLPLSHTLSKLPPLISEPSPSILRKPHAMTIPPTK